LPDDDLLDDIYVPQAHVVQSIAGDDEEAGNDGADPQRQADDGASATET